MLWHQTSPDLMKHFWFSEKCRGFLPQYDRMTCWLASLYFFTLHGISVFFQSFTRISNVFLFRRIQSITMCHLELFHCLVFWEKLKGSQLELHHNIHSISYLNCHLFFLLWRFFENLRMNPALLIWPCLFILPYSLWGD